MSPEAQNYLGEIQEYWRQQYSSNLTAEADANWRKHLDDIWYALHEDERYATTFIVVEDTRKRKEQT